MSTYRKNSQTTNKSIISTQTDQAITLFFRQKQTDKQMPSV